MQNTCELLFVIMKAPNNLSIVNFSHVSIFVNLARIKAQDFACFFLIPRGFHVETTWKRLFPRRFNVKSTWCVFTVYNHLRTFKNCFSIRNALNCHSITLLSLACAITSCTIFGKSRQASASMVVSVFISCMTICTMKKFKTIFSFRDIFLKSHLLKKCLMENFIFCALYEPIIQCYSLAASVLDQ